MKYFKVTFLPIHSNTMDYLLVQAASLDQAKKDFRGGRLVNIVELSKEEYDEEK